MSEPENWMDQFERECLTTSDAMAAKIVTLKADLAKWKAIAASMASALEQTAGGTGMCMGYCGDLRTVIGGQIQIREHKASCPRAAALRAYRELEASK